MSIVLCALRCAIPLLASECAAELALANTTPLRFFVQSALFIGGCALLTWRVARAAQCDYARTVERRIRTNQALAQSHQERPGRRTSSAKYQYE